MRLSFRRTIEFDAWLTSLRDPIGKARILARIRAAKQLLTRLEPES